MKLKYYLRGMGIGIILTAIVMGFALGGRKATISDAEVIERAKSLGMVDPTSGVLTQTTSGADTDEENTITSGEELDQAGEEVSEEVDQEFASNSESDSGLDETTVEGTKETESEKAEETAEASKSSTEDVKKSDTVVSEEVAEATETATDNSNEKSSEDQGQTDVASTDDTVKEPEITANNSSENETASNTETSSNTETTTNKTSGLGAKTTVTKTISIPGGLGSDQVAAILQREGIVDSAYSFNQYLCEHRMDRVIRSGQKTIPAGSTYQDIANIICK